MKKCDVGNHDVPVLFHARKKDRPSCCPNCYKRKPILAPTTIDKQKVSTYTEGENKVAKNGYKSLGIGKVEYAVQAKNKDLFPIYKSAIKSINRVSTKQAKINKAYTVLRKEFLRAKPNCAVCGGEATQVHHQIGRGIRTLDTSEWLPCCMSCHNDIEMNPEWAKENGYSKDRL